MAVVSESGLYRLTMTSGTPEAKRFTKWATTVLLPALRESGRYPALLADGPAASQARLIMAAVQGQIELQGQIEEVKAQVGISAEHSTLGSWCKKHGQALDHAELSREGQRLAKLCRERGIKLLKLVHVSTGEVTAYPVEVLAEWLEEYRRTHSTEPEPSEVPA